MEFSKFVANKWIKRLGATAAVFGVVAAGAPTAMASSAEVTQYKSGAYAEYSNIHDVKFGPFGQTRWPEGPYDTSIVDTHHDLVIVGAAQSDSSGDPETGLAKANATLGKLGFDLFHVGHAFPGLPSILEVSANGVNSQCSAKDGRLTGNASLGAINIRIGGQPFTIPARPAPNTKIGVPGIGYFTFNKQTTDKFGALEVTAISWRADDFLEKAIGGHFRSNFATVKCGSYVDFSDPVGVNEDEHHGHSA